MNMTDQDYHPPSESIAQWLQVLDQPTRLEILLVIGESEACVCHLEAALGQRQAYISQHLMALREAAIITSRREGRYVFYRLNDLGLLEFIRLAASLAGLPATVLTGEGRSAPNPDCPCPHCESGSGTQDKPEMEISNGSDPVG
jgi:DNA-binding transcriptional ArsR family regulator